MEIVYMFKSLKVAVTSVLRNEKRDQEDQGLIEELSGSDTVPEALAYTLLLLGLARADGSFHSNEEIAIKKLISRNFSTLNEDLLTLMETAHNMLDSFRSPSGFVDRIKQEYSPEERALLIKSIRDVIQADDTEEAIEKYLEQKYAKLLE